ncbi:MAG: hypothetical protein PHI35_06380 [Victivallaceae bacterium]|nr:hypothetical protein [Victivallaceae bacterium]
MKSDLDMLFLGEYEHSLDTQCRVSLPSDWRGKDGDTELVLIPAPEKSLLLLPISTFAEFFNKLKSQAIVNPRVQKAFAYLGANSRRCRCDKQGRIALDRGMLERIGVTGALKLIGAVTFIRLCAPGNWMLPEGDDGIENCLAEIREAGDNVNDLAGLLGGILGKK